MTSINYTFFWGGPLSNFHSINGDESFTSEKLYMYAKASFFGDGETQKLIMESSTPREAKRLGRLVKGFDQKMWDEVKVETMEACLHVKAIASKEFREALLNTGDSTIVEASPTDRIWGIGFKADDALSNIDKWGENLLGKCLMKVRSELWTLK